MSRLQTSDLVSSVVSKYPKESGSPSAWFPLSLTDASTELQVLPLLSFSLSSSTPSSSPPPHLQRASPHLLLPPHPSPSPLTQTAFPPPKCGQIKPQGI